MKKIIDSTGKHTHINTYKAFISNEVKRNNLFRQYLMYTLYESIKIMQLSFFFVFLDRRWKKKRTSILLLRKVCCQKVKAHANIWISMSLNLLDLLCKRPIYSLLLFNTSRVALLLSSTTLFTLVNLMPLNFAKKKKKKKKGRYMVYIELANFYRKIFESCCSSLFAKGKERYSLLLSDPTWFKCIQHGMFKRIETMFYFQTSNTVYINSQYKIKGMKRSSNRQKGSWKQGDKDKCHITFIIVVIFYFFIYIIQDVFIYFSFSLYIKKKKKKKAQKNGLTTAATPPGTCSILFVNNPIIIWVR
jgi:hypothetical protein